MLQVSKVLNFNHAKESDNPEIPLIKIWGMWLHNYGFKEGNIFKVECEQGRIILTVIDAKEVPSLPKEACLDGGICNALESSHQGSLSTL